MLLCDAEDIFVVDIALVAEVEDVGHEVGNKILGTGVILPHGIVSIQRLLGSGCSLAVGDGTDVAVLIRFLEWVEFECVWHNLEWLTAIYRTLVCGGS